MSNKNLNKIRKLSKAKVKKVKKIKTPSVRVLRLILDQISLVFLIKQWIISKTNKKEHQTRTRLHRVTLFIQ